MRPADPIPYWRASQELCVQTFRRPCLAGELGRPSGAYGGDQVTAWDQIFPSSPMTVAAVDRLVHHCHIVEISGDSHRRVQASRRSRSKQQERP
ncbi:MAG: ATP-binding protein [Cyanobium sp.]